MPIHEDYCLSSVQCGSDLREVNVALHDPSKQTASKVSMGHGRQEPSFSILFLRLKCLDTSRMGSSFCLKNLLFCETEGSQQGQRGKKVRERC